MDIVLITGATRGIGRAILENLKDDHFIYFTYKNSDELKDEIEKRYKNTRGFKVDSKNIFEIKKLFEFFEENSIEISTLVNNVSLSDYSLLLDVTEEEYQEVFDINVKSTIFYTKLAIKNMLKRKKGQIINISSIWGKYGASCESLYSCTKGAIIAFSNSIAKEYAISGIRSNSILPGPCATDMLKHFTNDELKEIEKLSYLNKLTDINDIAKTVRFVMENSSINGENIEVSGCIK